MPGVIDCEKFMWERNRDFFVDTLGKGGQIWETPTTGLKLTVRGVDGTEIVDYWTMEQFMAMVYAVTHHVACDDANLLIPCIGFDESHLN